MESNNTLKIKNMIKTISKDLQESRIDWKIMLLFLPVAFFTYLFHEFGHWIVGVSLGNQMVMSLNNSTTMSGSYLGVNDNLFISIGGPLFTILQAIMALVLIKRFKTIYALPFLFFAGFCRIFSDIFGGFNLQDESRIATMLDAGRYTVAIIVILILLLAILRGFLLLKINLKGAGYYTVISTLAILIVISFDKLFFR